MSELTHINPFVCNYAAAILLTARLQSESFDKDGADAATEADELRQKAEKEKGAAYTYSLVNYTTFYRRTLEECAADAVKRAGLDDKFGQAVYLSLTTAWNDILEWATDVEGAVAKSEEVYAKVS